MEGKPLCLKRRFITNITRTRFHGSPMNSYSTDSTNSPSNNPGTSGLSDQTLRFKSEYNKLTRLEQGVIDGLLLSDGSLRKPSKNHLNYRLEFTFKEAVLDFIV